VEAKKLQQARDRLQQQSLDEEEYRKNVVSWRQHRMKLALDKKSALEHQRAMVSKAAVDFLIGC